MTSGCFHPPFTVEQMKAYTALVNEVAGRVCEIFPNATRLVVTTTDEESSVALTVLVEEPLLAVRRENG